MASKKTILLSLLLLTSCGGSSSGGSDENVESDVIQNVETSFSTVFISKNDTQCNDDGLTLEETASYLSSANIITSESECGFIVTGLDSPAVCGASTNNVFIHTINASDLTEAENLGFTDTSTLEARFEVVECI